MSQELTIHITSFSFKQGLPEDYHGHGGGYIFDMRCLPNPGRIEKYKSQTGMDQAVIDYLAAEPKVEEYYQHSKALVFLAVKEYLDRQFEHLSVSFGCTGGQHRSVYFACLLAKDLQSSFDVAIDLKHRELEAKD